MLLDGSGTADSSGMLTGGGTFTRFIPSTTGGSCSDGSGSGSHQIVSSGTWKVTSVQSYTPGSRLGGGVLLLNVTLMPSGGTALTGTMQLSNTGTDSGVKLVLSSGDTFMPTGAGYVTIIAGTGSVRDDAVRGGAGH